MKFVEMIVMVQEFKITGMGCKGCVTRVKNTLLSIEDVLDASVRLEDPQAVITMNNSVSPGLLQEALYKVGHYTIRKKMKQDTVGMKDKK